jgi:hypothetical protein
MAGPQLRLYTSEKSRGALVDWCARRANCIQAWTWWNVCSTVTERLVRQSRAVCIMHLPRRYLQELGLKYETVSLDLSKQEHKAEAYLKVGHCLLAPSTKHHACMLHLYKVVACRVQLVDLDIKALCLLAANNLERLRRSTPTARCPLCKMATSCWCAARPVARSVTSSLAVSDSRCFAQGSLPPVPPLFEGLMEAVRHVRRRRAARCCSISWRSMTRRCRRSRTGRWSQIGSSLRTRRW